MTTRTTPTDDQFPEVFNNGKLRVYLNPREEVFVEDVRSGVTIRLNRFPHLTGGLQFTTSADVDPIGLQFVTDGRVEPIRVSNMVGWRVGPR